MINLYKDLNADWKI